VTCPSGPGVSWLSPYTETNLFLSLIFFKKKKSFKKSLDVSAVLLLYLEIYFTYDVLWLPCSLFPICHCRRCCRCCSIPVCCYLWTIVHIDCEWWWSLFACEWRGMCIYADFMSDWRYTWYCGFYNGLDILNILFLIGWLCLSELVLCRVVSLQPMDIVSSFFVCFLADCVIWVDSLARWEFPAIERQYLCSSSLSGMRVMHNGFCTVDILNWMSGCIWYSDPKKVA